MKHIYAYCSNLIISITTNNISNSIYHMLIHHHHHHHHHIRFYVRFTCWHSLNGFQKIDFQANLSLARSLLTLLFLKFIIIHHFFPCFLWPSSTSWTWHLNCSASTNPETLVHSLNVTSNNILHKFYSKNRMYTRKANYYQIVFASMKSWTTSNSVTYTY